MKHEVKKFDPLSTSKITALLYAPFGLIHVALGVMMLNNTNPQDDVTAKIFLLMPLIMAVATFVSTYIGCVVYNWLASKIGGVEVELE